MTKRKLRGISIESLQVGPGPAAKLVELTRSDPPSMAQKIVYYLLAAKVIVRVGRIFGNDAFDPSRVGVVSPHIHSDGVWAWQAGLAYYVAMYNLELPSEFLSSMAAREWQPGFRTEPREEFEIT